MKLKATKPAGKRQRRRMSFRMRLILGYVVIIALLLGFGGISLQQFRRIVAANQQLAAQTERALAAEALARDSLELLVAIDDGIYVEDSAQFAAQVEPALASLDASYQTLRPMLVERARLDSAVSNLVTTAQPLLNQAKVGSWAEIRSARTVLLKEKLARVSTSIDEIVRTTAEDRTLALAEALAAQRGVYSVILGGFVLAVGLGSYMAVTALQNVSRTVSQLSTGAARLAAGDLHYQVVADTQDELGQLAHAFNEMAEQLRELYAGQEQRIAERTATLADLNQRLLAAGDIGRAVNTVLDPTELQDQVVALISERMGFYHVGLFLLDEASGYAVMYAASSENGRRMLAHGHRLRIGEGIVGRVAAIGRLYVAQDVGGDAVHYKNPNLPATRSEAALPLKARGRIFGILDVQSTQENAFSDAYTAILQTMTDQVAMALANARLYQEAQESLERARRLYGELEHKSWADIVAAYRGAGYRFARGRGTAREQIWYEEMEEALRRGELVQIEADASDGVVSLAAPLRVREQVVGVLNLRKAGGEWTTRELDFVKNLVDQMGPTLENARLLDETRLRAEREQLVRTVSAQLRASRNVEAVLQATVRELGRVLGASGTIRMVAPVETPAKVESAS